MLRLLKLMSFNCIKALAVIWTKYFLIVELQLLPNDILRCPVLTQSTVQYMGYGTYLCNNLRNILIH